MNTEVLSKSLNEFARKNKMSEDQYKQLKGRRNTILKLIKRYSEFKGLAVSQEFNVGSYKIRTGVQREAANGWAFDIDYVLVYNQEFDYETFKNNLTDWLRKEVKDKYKRIVIVSNKKKVVSVAFRNDENTKTDFYLDIALYLNHQDNLFHIKRDDEGEYELKYGCPKDTYTRQKDALHENEDKRNAIIILKYLKEKNRIKGTSSIFITDKIISYSDLLDTFSLIKKFISENQIIQTFELKEAPFSNLIKDYKKLNESLKEMNKKFFTENSTLEIYKAMNSWLDYKLPDLDKEIMEERNERYSGG